MKWWMPLIPVAGAGLALALVGGDDGPRDPNKPSGGGGGSSSSTPPRSQDVPFAGGGDAPMWPLIRSEHPRRFEVPYIDENGKWHGNRSRAFAADRGERWHAGVDLYANGEDIIVAPEAGVIVGRQSLYKGTGAMMLATDSGVNILLGETLMGGASEFGVDVGTRVERGQPLTRVGWHDEDPSTPGIQGGAHMLHLEMYEPGITQNKRWPKSSAAPAGLLDPTQYLLRARAATVVA